MAKDDYYVIAYKLLKYLYNCMKKNHKPQKEIYGNEHFKIEYTYWEYIIRNLYNEGYIDGVLVLKDFETPDGTVIINPNFQITPKGIDYIQNNSAFNKVKETLKDISDILPI